ncbi:hypothetical protein [Microbacterium sp.]|uniref:hypothetical protein n=1 Tax=Microbacterium sp. TaxID=51671 RepID=UPI003F9A4212
MASGPVDHRWHVTARGEVLESYRLGPEQNEKYVLYETTRTVTLEELIGLTAAGDRLMRRASATSVLMLVPAIAAIGAIVAGFFVLPATGASESLAGTVGFIGVALLLVAVFSLPVFHRVMRRRIAHHHAQTGLVQESAHTISEKKAQAMIADPGTRSSAPD